MRKFSHLWGREINGLLVRHKYINIAVCIRELITRPVDVLGSECFKRIDAYFCLENNCCSFDLEYWLWVTKNLYLSVPSHNLIWCENNSHINYLSLFLISTRSNCGVKSVFKKKHSNYRQHSFFVITYKFSRQTYLNF